MSTIRDPKSFEAALDAEFDRLPCWDADAEHVIVLAANMIEASAERGPEYPDHLARGLHALLPRLIQQGPGAELDVEPLLRSMDFGSHYYLLRELLYYTYNAAGSCTWSFGSSNVDVSYADPSIPRQFYIQANQYLTDSVALFADYKQAEEVVELLRGVDEFQVTENGLKAYELISAETDLKLTVYFSILDPASTVDFGGYTYADFFKINRTLVTKALYHRYHAKANGIYGAVFLDREVFTGLVVDELKVSRCAAEAVLADLAYSPRSARQRIQPMHYPLIYLPRRDQYLMMPHRASIHEGLVNILRVRAIADPAHFQLHIAPALDQAFTRSLRAEFEQQGFSVHTNVPLRQFDELLPDIDLLVISLEPTFGFFVYVGEVKASIPPMWAKDHLKVLSKDNIPKAFEQLERLEAFLISQQGIAFLNSLLPSEGIPHFGKKFLLALKLFIITSNNSGGFFNDSKRTIVDYRTLREAVRKSDGDVTYINRALAGMASAADNNLKVTKAACSLADTSVTYDAVQVNNLLVFEQNRYRSDGTDKRIAEKFIAGGGHPYDTLRDLPQRNGSSGP